MLDASEMAGHTGVTAQKHRLGLETEMSITDLPRVSSCSVDACGYNHDGCHAPAINIDENDNCTTFMALGEDGGLPKVVAAVGACQRTDCAFNSAGVCGAASVRISGGSTTAHCETYKAA